MASDAFTLVQVSDLHLDPEQPASLATFARVTRRARALRPQVMLISGDASDRGAEDPAHLTFAKKQLKQLPGMDASLVMPGNHDVGNRGGFEDPPVNAARVRSYMDVFGADHFCYDRGRWTIIGINSLIVGSGLASEQTQLTWLKAQLKRARAEKRLVAFFSHEPLFLNSPDEAYGDHSDYWTYPLPQRRAYLALLEQPHVRLIASGHVHWRHERPFGSGQMIWCPSVSIAVDDARFPGQGRMLGFVRYHFDAKKVRVEYITTGPAKQLVFYQRPQLRMPDGEMMVLGYVVLRAEMLLSAEGMLTRPMEKALRQLCGHTRIRIAARGKAAKAFPRAAWPESLQLDDTTPGPGLLRGLDHSVTVAVGAAGSDDKWLKKAGVALAVGNGAAANAGRATSARCLHAPDITAALAMLNAAKDFKNAVRT